MRSHPQPRSRRGASQATAPEAAIRSWVDRDMVFDLGDARGSPGGALRFLAFCPGTHAAPEDHFASIRVNSDSIGIDFCAAPKGFLDFRLDVGRCDTRLEKDQIADPFDTADAAHGFLGPRALVVPFRCSLEREPAVLHGHLHGLGRVWQFVLEGGDRIAGNLRIRALAGGRKANLNIVGDPDDTRYALHVTLGLPFLGVAANEPRKGYNTAFNGNTDIRWVN